MQRTTITLTPATREEWTKYFVNGIECERWDIYQIILDNHFYNGKVILDKKYHFHLHEEKTIEESIVKHENEVTHGTTNNRTIRNDQNDDRSANFNLDTKKFTEKFAPNSEQYKVLVEKMINTLDMMFEALSNYDDNANYSRSAIRNLITYNVENTENTHTPYNKILFEGTIEMAVFIIDMMIFTSSIFNKKPETDIETLSPPNLTIDLSNMKEEWNDNWSNEKKSKFVGEFLSVVSKQVDLIYQSCVNSNVFSDQPTKNEMKRKFDEFKILIETLQAKKALIDTRLANLTSPSASLSTSSLFHFKEDMSEPTKASNNTPKNGF